MKIFALDKTFGQALGRAGLSFSLADRMAIAREIDRLGIDYLEMGCPGASASARKFFDYARTECRLANTRLVASARLDRIIEPLETDPEIEAALHSEAPVIAISAQCWRCGTVNLEPYRRKIAAVVGFLKARGLDVIFREENFFQLYREAPVPALETLESAKAAGANVLCLGDSAGAADPRLVREAAAEIWKRFAGTLGISAQDNSDLALANTLEAVAQGFSHVEGSLNAYGNRRGMANLCSVISNLERRMGHMVIGPERLVDMTKVARLVSEAGSDALDRRGHIPMPAPAAAEENLFDGLDPALLLRLSNDSRRGVLNRVEFLQASGYELNAATGTLELLVREALQPELHPFVAERYELASHGTSYSEPVSSATAIIRVEDMMRVETEDGDGAVNAMERALRQCLFALYPEVVNLRVTNYRVQIDNPAQGTTARVRVSLNWETVGSSWVTQGASGDLVEATWRALVDGFRLYLMRLERAPLAHSSIDSSWAV